MPSVQTDYGQYHARAQLGMIGTTMYKDVVSKTNTTSDNIPFGRVCSLDGEDGCHLAAGPFGGVTVAQAVLDQVGLLPGGTAKADEFCGGETVGLLRNGTIWVEAADAVSANDTAKYNTDGSIGVGASLDFPGVAIFETDAAAGELVRLRLES